jgi:methylated-DNA-[protein]-cysteine S-methyltransferase
MKNQLNIQYSKTPYGELILGEFGEQLCLCDWRYRKMREAVDSHLFYRKISIWLDYDSLYSIENLWSYFCEPMFS